MTPGEYIPVKESNFGPIRMGQSKKLSTFNGWAERTNQSQKFSAAFIRSKASWIKKKRGKKWIRFSLLLEIIISPIKAF